MRQAGGRRFPVLCRHLYFLAQELQPTSGPAYGWTWYVSPWGSGPYHYGAWVRRPWAPRGWHGAWVAQDEHAVADEINGHAYVVLTGDNRPVIVFGFRAVGDEGFLNFVTRVGPGCREDAQEMRFLVLVQSEGN